MLRHGILTESLLGKWMGHDDTDGGAGAATRRSRA